MIAIFHVASVIIVSGLRYVYCMESEPRCYSRFDWEDQLLEKTIRKEVKVQQYMEKLEAAMDELKGLKDEFEELTERFDSKTKQFGESVENRLTAFASNLTATHDVQTIGTIYTRWGRTTCPENDSEHVYDGYAAGSQHTHKGAAASMLCLPKDPDWDVRKFSDKLDPDIGYIYGAEYQDGQARSDHLFGRNHHDQDVPCVVCNVKRRSSTLMIAGKTRCYSGWTFEYSGYLMTGHYNHPAASNYYCIDKDPENLGGGAADKNGYLLYFVESRCGSLRCPPYADGREMSCVVCTK